METYIHRWFKQRGASFIGKRFLSLLNRYGATPTKIIEDISTCVAILAEFDCQPTFFVPGVIIQRYPQFIHQLHQAGTEIAVHGYHHVDLSALPVEDARDALVHSVQVLKDFGVEPSGFRGPYLGCSDALLESIPTGLFDYSSNVAIRWNNISSDFDHSSFSKILDRLYRVKPFETAVCIPWIHFGLVEIPVCIPDDLQLYDGFNMTPEELARYWCQMLRVIHERGELFTLLFHSELASICGQPFRELFQEIQQLELSVWVAKLSEISDWWWEKSEFKVEVINNSNSIQLSFTASPRATILARELEIDDPQCEWDGTYNRLCSRNIQLRSGVRPFVGLPSTASKHVISFLGNQGYILDNSEHNHQCTVYVDDATLSRLESEVQLVNYIEASTGPLIRFGHWPDGAKSALSISGDLDALSLIDYGTRVINR